MQTRTLTYLTLIVGSLASGSCVSTERIIAPEVVHPDGFRPTVYSNVSSDGWSVSLFAAEDGTTYTLDLQAREIRDSHGRILELDSEQAEVAANAFFSIVENDQIANHFEMNPPPHYCDPEPNGCVVDPMGGSPGNDEMHAFSISRVDATGRPRVHYGGQFGVRVQGNVRDPAERTGRRQGDVSISSNHETICSSMLQELYPTVDSHRQGRTSWLGDLFRGAFGAATAGGAVVRRMLGGGAQALGYNVADHFYRRISLGIMEGFWNGYNCDNRYPRWYNTVFRPSSGGWTIVCKSETWQICFNGNCRSVDVQVCGYQHEF